MLDLHSHWQTVWAAKDPLEVSWFQPEPTLSLAMIEAAGLKRDAPIVDVGGGASLLVDRLVEKGYRHVAVLDIAASSLAKAAERLGSAADEVLWVECDLLAWKPVPHLYALWHDRAVLHFLTEPTDQQAYVRVLKQALAPEGSVILAAFAPDGPQMCSGLPVCRHDSASLARLLGDEFTLVDERREEHITPGGKGQRFCWARFRRVVPSR